MQYSCLLLRLHQLIYRLLEKKPDQQGTHFTVENFDLGLDRKYYQPKELNKKLKKIF